MNKQAFLRGFQTRLAQLQKQAGEEGSAWSDPWTWAKGVGHSLAGGQSANKGVQTAGNVVQQGARVARTMARPVRAVGRALGLGGLVPPAAPPSQSLTLMQRLAPRLANSRFGKILGGAGTALGTATAAVDTALSNNPYENDPRKNAFKGMLEASMGTTTDPSGRTSWGLGGGTGANHYANAQRAELNNMWGDVRDNPGIVNTLSAVGQTVAPWHGGQVMADNAASGIASGIYGMQNPGQEGREKGWARAVPGAVQTGDAADQYELNAAQDRMARGVDQWGRPAQGGTAEDQATVQRVSQNNQYNEAGAADRAARGVDEWNRPAGAVTPWKPTNEVEQRGAYELAAAQDRVARGVDQWGRPVAGGTEVDRTRVQDEAERYAPNGGQAQPQSVAQQVWPNAQGRAPQ